MIIKRLISNVTAVALVISALSFSASADINKKPLEIGFEIGQERQNANDFDFTVKPYSITTGDYYMGLSVCTISGTYRGLIGESDEYGQETINMDGQRITNINARCPWAYLYNYEYAKIVNDRNGVPLMYPVTAFGPAGILTENAEGKKEIIENAKINDVKITGSGTYTVGIQGFNFKDDSAKMKWGNGITSLRLSSNIKCSEADNFEIKNPILKLYNTKEEYEAKKPYKTIQTGYWFVQKYNVKFGYVVYHFIGDFKNGGRYTFNSDDKNNKITVDVNFDKKYEDKLGKLDTFGLSPFTGVESDKYQSGYEGCTYLPEYAMEITFDFNKTSTSKSNSIYSKKNDIVSPVKTIKSGIKTKKAVIKKVTATKKKTLKITWKKVSGANGYEIKLATNRKFTKNKRTFKVKKGTYTSKVIRKLKSGKRYYVKLRAYKKVEVDGYTVTANGSWSVIRISKKIK